MKKYLMVLIAVLVVIMAGCSVMYDGADVIETTVSFSVSNSTTLQEEQTTYQTTMAAKTTEKETTSTTKSVVATSKVETTANPTTNNQTTTKSTTTTKPTTEKKVTQSPSTTKHTTTKKATTTQKQTTTKPKTTEAPYFCDEGGTHHSCKVGPIGWVSSYQKATDAALKYIANHDTSGNFTVEECWYCGKYTASVILD